MSEALEKALERESRRLDNSIFNPVIVRTQEDIRSVLIDYDPKRQVETRPIKLSTTIVSDDNSQSINVATETKSKSKRDYILEGLSVVKNQIDILEKSKGLTEAVEINGKVVKPAKFGGSSGISWIDPIIKQWLGGYRDGLNICWDIDGYKYMYDIFNHKLSRISINED